MNLLNIKEQLASIPQITFNQNTHIALGFLLASRTHLCPERAMKAVMASEPYELNVTERTEVSNILNTIHEFMNLFSRDATDMISVIECFMTWRANVAFCDHNPILVPIEGTDHITRVSGLNMLPPELLSGLELAGRLPGEFTKAVCELKLFFHIDNSQPTMTEEPEMIGGIHE